MVDMQLTHEQAAATLISEPIENNGPRYPMGLQICLDEDTLRKLAMGLPQVGDRFTLAGLVEVLAVSKDPGQIEDDKHVRLQIVAMELGNQDARNDQQRAHDRIAAMFG